MKRILLTTVLAFITYCSFAQTNTFPTTGNVGIGTLSPAYALDVNTSSVVIRANDPLTIVNRNSIFQGQTYTNTAQFGSIANNANAPFNSIDGTYIMNRISSYGLYFTVNNGGTEAKAMSILSTGNIGIGTVSPSAKLHVVGNEAIRVQGVGASGPGTIGTITFYDSDNTTRHGYIGDAASGNPDLYFSADAGGGLNFGTNGTNARMYINSSGYVGINTLDTKGYQFAVNGSAIATSMTVKLNASWPDYVFKKDYQLPTLQELKIYIDQNQHLPDMPSAQEVVENGLNLGEMNKLLVKKVEELTLYLIELKKENTEFKDKLKNIEIRLNTN
jgi:hypothetical protein